MPQPGICCSLLGGFSLYLGEREIPEAAFRSRKALNLVKLLSLAANHRLHRDQVLEALWPALDPLSASAQLYKAVHYARQVFTNGQETYDAENVLHYQQEILSLTAPGGVHTDVEAFGHLAQDARRSKNLPDLQRAAACYGGDLLPADLYESWTDEQRTSLQQILLDLLVELGQKSIRDGYLANAADAFRRILSLDPLDEKAHQGLMHVFALQGSRSQALHQFKRCRDILSAELGIKPSAATLQLYEDIRSGKTGAENGAGSGVKKAKQTTVTAQTSDLAPLIGRREEVRAVTDALDLLQHGKGGLLLAGGSAGIGKTRLTQEIGQLAARRGFAAMYGCCYEEKNAPPYSPVVEALRSVVNRFENHLHLLPAELTAAIPELTYKPVNPAIEDEMAAQGYLFAGVLRFLKAVAAESPLVFIVDDLHLADEGTLKLFNYLARNAADFPFLLVGAWRTGETHPSPVLRDLLAFLQRGKIATFLNLSPLSEEQHQKLLRQNLAQGEIDARLAGEIFSHTEGNPLFAIEMLNQLKQAGKIKLAEGLWQVDALDKPYIPPTLQLLLVQKWNLLSPNAQSLLNVIAVAGQQTSLNLLEAITNSPAEEILDLLDEMFSQHILKEAGLSFQFVHPLFREALYQQMSNTRKSYLHGQVGGILARLFENNSDSPVEAIAGHFLHSDRPLLAAPFLVLAGDRAAALYAHESAIGFYRQALETDASSQAAELGEKLGDQLGMLGKEHESAAEYEKALLLCDEKDRDRLKRKAAYRYTLAGNLNDSWRYIAETTATLPQEPDIEWVSWQYVRAHYHWQRNEFSRALEVAQTGLRAAQALDAAEEINRAYEMMALCCAPLGEWQMGLEFETLRMGQHDLNRYLTDVSDVHL